MNRKRVDELMAGHDSTFEVSDELLQDAISNYDLCVLQTSIEFVDVIFMWLQCPLR